MTGKLYISKWECEFTYDEGEQVVKWGGPFEVMKAFIIHEALRMASYKSCWRVIALSWGLTLALWNLFYTLFYDSDSHLI